MYVRKNRIGRGESARTYVAIAHSVWRRVDGRRSQSRPLIVANLGASHRIDMQMAHELAVAIDQLVFSDRRHRRQSLDSLVRAVAEVRRIEPFLRLLVQREGGLAHRLPPSTHRTGALVDLLRARIAGETDDQGHENTHRPSVPLRSNESEPLNRSPR